MKPIFVITVVVTLAATAATAFWLGRQHAPEATAPERRVLYWHDPMVPGQRFDKPGKSPFMDMALQPVYADSAEAGEGVRISPQMQQNLGLRLARVSRAEVDEGFDAVGSLQFDERQSWVVQTRVAGYLERLLVRAPLERVAAGQLLAWVYAPEWLAPLHEFAALRRSGAPAEGVAAARERLQALSVPSELVRQVEQGGEPQARFALRAPAGGVVAELGVREGMSVAPGMTLFRIAALSPLWVVAEVPEAQALRLRRGQAVQGHLQGDTERRVAGRVQEILPQVNPSTRTVQARFEIDNPGGPLLPGLLLRLRISGAKATRLLVPAEAVLRTGTRAVVILRSAAGRFEPREVQLGADLGEHLEVRAGLAEGDEVVASGQFLIDAEARLRSSLAGLSTTPEVK